MVAEKSNFSSNAKHNFAEDKVISKHKNDTSTPFFRFSPLL